MLDAMKKYQLRNETNMEKVLKDAVKFFKKQKGISDRSPSCQQAIILLTDSLYFNYTGLMQKLDPKGNIR